VDKVKKPCSKACFLVKKVWINKVKLCTKLCNITHPPLSILKKAKKNLLTTDLALQSTVIHTFSTTGGKVLNSDI
jgi:hypothetical protein